MSHLNGTLFMILQVDIPSLLCDGHGTYKSHLGDRKGARLFPEAGHGHDTIQAIDTWLPNKILTPFTCSLVFF